jgi:hypothetical protein
LTTRDPLSWAQAGKTPSLGSDQSKPYDSL